MNMFMWKSTEKIIKTYLIFFIHGAYFNMLLILPNYIIQPFQLTVKPLHYNILSEWLGAVKYFKQF